MAFGLESRAPFLDHLLAETSARLPLELKATPRETKVALRHLAARLLPKPLAERRKQGFSLPLRTWFAKELQQWTRDCLLHQSQAMPLYFNQPFIQSTLDDHARGRRDHSVRIYTLLVFELWHRNFFRT